MSDDVNNDFNPNPNPQVNVNPQASPSMNTNPQTNPNPQVNPNPQANPNPQGYQAEPQASVNYQNYGRNDYQQAYQQPYQQAYQQPYQQAYQQPYQQAYQQDTAYQNYQTAQAQYENNAHTSVGQWMITYLIMMIPIVNIVMLFVWAFSDTTGLSKKNWAKATLIWSLIAFGLGILLILILLPTIGYAIRWAY